MIRQYCSGLFRWLNWVTYYIRTIGKLAISQRESIIHSLKYLPSTFLISVCVITWNIICWYGYSHIQQNHFAMVWSRMRHGLRLHNKSSDIEVNYYIQQLATNKTAFYKLNERATPFLYYIIEEIEKRQLPTELALLPMIESAFQPTATSEKGAAGLWQIMPSTGKQNGLKQDRWYDGRKDIAASTHVALDYLEYLYKSFNYNWDLALAAYNAGEGTVQKAIQKLNKDPKKITLQCLDLPTETKTFIPKLYAIVELIKHAKKYDIVLPKIANKPYFIPVNVGFQIPLQTAAKLADIPVQTIKNLNPAYTQGTTHPKGPHQLLLPLTHARKFEYNLEQLLRCKKSNV